MRPLDPIMSPHSDDPAKIAPADIVAELMREIGQRRSAYPERIEAGKLDRETGERRIAILEAVAADVRASALAVNAHRSDEWRDARNRAMPLLAPFRWSDIVEELAREIRGRRKHYPQMVADGALDAIAAKLQLERLEAAHALYWLRARRWWPDELDSKRYRGDLLTEAEHEVYRAAYERHRGLFEPIDTHPRGGYAEGAQLDGWAA